MILPTGVSIAGRGYRIVNFAYFHDRKGSLLYDEGPLRGGRYSPPGDHKGLYVALDLATAERESQQSLKSFMQEPPAGAWVTYEVQFTLSSVLDLCDAKVRSRMKVSKASLLEPWRGLHARSGRYPLTWTIGASCFGSNSYDGIRFPSSKHPKGENLLVFTERLKTKKTIKVYDSGQNLLEAI